MRKCNVVIVYDQNEENILMCERRREPYKGLLNLIGGKVEKDESELTTAYRELEEETGITQQDITLVHLMNFQYMMDDLELEVYVGKLRHEVELVEEVNQLCWLSKTEDFFDCHRFAGEGNIGHMLMQVEFYREKCFN